MKRILIIIAMVSCILSARAESALRHQVYLTPYIKNNNDTPTADKVLLDKLNRIILKYDGGEKSVLPSPFIITGNAIELNRDVTATVPAQMAVAVSLTLYIGNGEDGTNYTSCNFNLRGAGPTLDKAYASAFGRLNLNDPELVASIEEGRKKIEAYYRRLGPQLLKKAEMYAAAGDYAEAYGVLLRVPPICPQYEEAQDMILSLIREESDKANGELISRARAAWNANPTERGAGEARKYLDQLSNMSPQIQKEAEDLMTQMGQRLQRVQDSKMALAEKRAKDAHAERMMAIDRAAKIAEQRAKRPEYVIHWW